MDDVKLRYQPEPMLAWALVDGSSASCSIVIGVINNAYAPHLYYENVRGQFQWQSKYR